MAYGVPAAVAAMLGLLIMPPRTAREFTVRTISTVGCSFLFGPVLAGAVIAWKPGLMDAMIWLSQHGAGTDGRLAGEVLRVEAKHAAGRASCVVGIGGVHAMDGKHEAKGLAAMAGRGPREAVGRAAWWGGVIVDLKTVIEVAIEPALTLLPAKMDTSAARVLLLAIGLQESRFLHHRQLGDGPARGLRQFERSEGVRGVLTHPASRQHAYRICAARGVNPVAAAVHPALETDDVLAANFARLLMWTDAWRVPAVGNVQGAWELYIRIWQPGRPHP